jgi:arabinan endo-1,5-alpha-L-arabinosidase
VPFSISIILLLCLRAAAQTGDVAHVHDPSIIQAGGTFYLFCTGQRIPSRVSTDLFHWQRTGAALPAVPQWTRDYEPLGRSMWAPDISFVDGEYRLYYAVSAFGKTASAIGLAVSKTLDPTSSAYRWIDRGKVISTPEHNDWNAIDPCAFEDAQGHAWMVLGSCWSGIKLAELDRKTGLLARPGEAPLAVSAYPPTNIVEEGYIRRHGDFYYLWESVGFCCRGVDSTYRILVGRSKDVRGPYLDRDGTPLLRGGGTLVLASYDNVRGPGSCAILPLGEREFLIHHMYDAGKFGTPTLQIRQLHWADDGWPVAGEPIRGPVNQKISPADFSPGDWLVRTDFGEPKRMTIAGNGNISPGQDTWRLQRRTLVITHQTAAKTFTDRFLLSDDGSYFVGRNELGLVVTGTHASAGK